MNFRGGGAAYNPAPVRVLFKFTLLGQFMSDLGNLFSQTRSLARYRFENKFSKSFVAKQRITSRIACLSRLRVSEHAPFFDTQSKNGFLEAGCPVVTPALAMAERKTSKVKRCNNNVTNSSPLTIHFSLNNETVFSPFTSHFSLPKNPAFTMAEVLITLGIIGIIAAMTLPALIQRKQEKVTVNQLKKSYSLLQQVYQRMVYEIASEPKDWGMTGMYDASSHIIMANKFAPYFKILHNCIGKDYEFTRKHCVDVPVYATEDSFASVRLIDGTTLIFRHWTGQCNFKWGTTKPLENVCGEIIVDVNGTKSPNMSGQDMFAFYLTNYGIIPAGMQGETSQPFKKHCNLSSGPWGTDLGGNFKNGFGCTAWVVFNENMDYLRCKDLDWGGKTKCGK